MIGPKYAVPSVPTSARFKEADQATSGASGDGATWLVAKPNDSVDRGAWWEMFGDPKLDELEAQLTVGSQDLKAAEARLRQARALVGVQAAAEYPALVARPSAASVKDSGNQPYIPIPNPKATGQYVLPIDLSYEIDLWGRVRRSVDAAKQEAQATEADLATANLSLHAELAIDYMELRSDDAQQKLLNDTVAAYKDALDLTRSRFNGGAASASDVAQAESQLATVQVQATDVAVARTQNEHAIAVLMGMPPAALSLSPELTDFRLPAIPVTLPSSLLQRRPDIAAAERRVAEANEQIGIAMAAYYPSFSLGGGGGVEGTSLANWFAWPSIFWAVGASASETLFDAGKRDAEADSARANYDVLAATYRQTTLSAFQQVEDNLAALRILNNEDAQQSAAVSAANEALRIATNRYAGGFDPYLLVITSQTAALANQRGAVDVRRRRMEAAVLLIKALGGGWDASMVDADAARLSPNRIFGSSSTEGQCLCSDADELASPSRSLFTSTAANCEPDVDCGPTMELAIRDFQEH
jgi:NodT family efflux transporter outer membrane factor (OMF) lipoprotein